MPTAFNVWTPEGNVVPKSLVTGASSLGNPNVIFDGSPVILAGPNVFKMWAMATVGINYTLNYFESADGLTGWTAYSLNPIATSAAPLDPKVFKVAGTFYIYTGQGSSINLTTSTDGVTLSNQGTVLSVGGVGTWDSTQIAQICLLDIIAGTWYAYYAGTGSTGQNGFMGLITSPDGKVWTKSPSNPIIQVLSTNFTFQKVGGTYYGWSQVVSNAALVSSGSIATFFSRFTATNPSGPWTQLKSGSAVVGTYYAAAPSDFISTNNIGNQLADPSIVQALGNTYLYYDVSFNGAVQQVNAAIATGQTVAQIVGSYEGIVGAPISGAPQLNLVTLDSDPGTGANANPIGGNWTPLATTGAFTSAQRLSNLIQGTTVQNNADSWWNARVYANDQWAQITFNITATSGFIGPELRMNKAGTATTYRLAWGGGALGTSHNATIQRVVSTTATVLTTLAGLTVNQGDTFLGVVNGTALYLYWNGFLIGSATDSNITSGSPGFEMFNASVVANAAISAWSGGSFQAAPPINPTGTGTGSLMLMGCGT